MKFDRQQLVFFLPTSSLKEKKLSNRTKRNPNDSHIYKIMQDYFVEAPFLYIHFIRKKNLMTKEEEEEKLLKTSNYLWILLRTLNATCNCNYVFSSSSANYQCA